MAALFGDCCAVVLLYCVTVVLFYCCVDVLLC